MTRTANATAATLLTDTPRQPALQLKRLLVATDFSPRSRPALEYTAGLAREYGATLHLLHTVVTLPVPGSPLASQSMGKMEPIAAAIQAREYAELEMAKLRTEDCLRGIQVKTLVREGPIADVVAEIARERAIDLVIVGTAGRHGIKRVAFGSAAEQIIRKSPCPVLVAGHRKPFPASPGKSIVVCAIRTPACAEAIRYAWKLSADHQAKLIFVHVVEAPSATAYSFDKAMTEAVMREAIMRAVSPAPMPKCELAIEYDYGWEGILHCAHENHAEFIVMGAHKLDSFVETSTHLGHSTIGEIISGARCPVFAIPDIKKVSYESDDFATLADEIC